MYAFMSYWEKLPARYTNSYVAKAAYESLRTYYAEPWRHYHTWDHVQKFQACLDEIEQHGYTVPLTVRIAGYYHDVIWLPGYKDNEDKSAELAWKWLHDVGCEEGFKEEVSDLIMATTHSGEPPSDHTEAMMRDADLATLGTPDWDYFALTQKNIRKEFYHVPLDDYLNARKSLFDRMCRNQVFWHPYMFQFYEDYAQANLKREGLTN